ncbi:YHS domain-containing protein [Nocardia vaccinii]|uniref:YHS domain-containing protein n=1 Tax=Nocardia vaccinii TaxID=1822 RepID=UPI00082E8134|nr:YHS domain-containing protein [Nocardia vaccinii]
MLFCEIYLPRGTHTPEQLRELSDRLALDRLVRYYAATDGDHAEEAASADPGVMTMLADLNHVVIHEIGQWAAGGQPVTSTDPRYLARIYLPAPWRKEMSAFLISAVTAALRTLVTEPQRSRIEVQILGIPDGSYGLDGRIVGEAELLEMISVAKSGPTVPVDSAVLIDPVCGMTAANPELTLEHGGTVYGFCSAGCRKHFSRKLADEATR